MLVLKLHLRNLFGFNKVAHSKSKKAKAKAAVLGVLFAIVVLYLAALVFAYCYFLGDMLTPSFGLGLMVVLGSVLALISSFLRGGSVLLGGRDMHMLLSLPLQTRDVVLGKLMYLYLCELGMASIAVVPALVAYAILAAPGPLFYLLALLMLVAIPVLPMLLGSVLGVLISHIASSFRYKNVVVFVLSVALFVAALLPMMFITPEGGMEELTQMLGNLTDTMLKVYPPAQLYMAALVEQNWLVGLLVVAASALLLVLSGRLVSRRYLQLIEGFSGRKAIKGSERAARRAKPVVLSIAIKDMRKLFSAPMVAMNVLSGVLVMGLLVASALFGQERLFDSLALLDLSGGAVGMALPFLLGALGSMVNYSSVSISLEGKNLPLLKSLPIRPVDVFAAKCLPNLLFGGGMAVICGPVLCAALGLDAGFYLWSILLPLMMITLSAQLGIVINLLFPKLDWVNEIVVVKQSLAAMLGLFSGMLLHTGIGALVLVPSKGSPLGLPVAAAGYALLILLMHVLLKTWGERRFLQL